MDSAFYYPDLWYSSPEITDLASKINKIIFSITELDFKFMV